MKTELEEIKQLMNDIAPYSIRGRIYYAILEAQDRIEEVEFMSKYPDSKKYTEKTISRLKNHLLNLRNFCYSTYVLGESNNKSKLLIEK